MSNNAFPYIQPDFYSESELVIGEIFSHIGKPKKGQDNKIANDILKMLLLDKFTGKIHRKIIVVCDEAEKKKLQGLSALAEGMLALLGNISAKRLCQFDERSRGSSEGYLHSSVKIDWCSERLHRKDMPYLTDAQYTAVLCAGTFHGNGYCRQICVEELKDWENSLPYLMLRLNDWALPVLDKVKNSGRRENQQVLKVEQEISCQMHRKFADCKLWDIPEYEISVKNAIYRFVYQNDVLNLSKLERLLLLEKSSYGKGLLVQAVFKHPDCTKEKIFQYLSDRSSVVRYYALKQYYDICRNVWPDLEWMLLDKARKIRDYAEYILKKHADFDVLGFYKEQLNREKSKAAIWGIGENGTAAELAVLSPYLEVGDVHLQKVALQAYGMIAREQGEEVYWTFLQNTEPLLFVQAYRLLVKYDVKYGAKPVFELYEKCTELPAADYLIRLLVREPCWKRMPYLLLLCDAERLSENMKKLIFFAIQHRSMYGSITSQEAEVIRKRLEEKSKCFSEKVVEDILWDMKFVIK